MSKGKTTYKPIYRTVHKPSSVGWSERLPHVPKLCDKLNLPWDYEVLAITETHVLVFLEEKEEYVSYQHDNKGNAFCGFYTKDKAAATNDFVKRMRIFL